MQKKTKTLAFLNVVSFQVVLQMSACIPNAWFVCLRVYVRVCVRACASNAKTNLQTAPLIPDYTGGVFLCIQERRLMLFATIKKKINKKKSSNVDCVSVHAADVHKSPQ